MRFLHLADLHIGKQVNGFSMIQDQHHVLGQVIHLLKEHEVDALVLAGDIYDKVSPSEEAVKLFDWFLTETVNLGVELLVTPGNHDSAERLAFGRRLMETKGVHIPPVFGGEIFNVALEDQHGVVRFWLMPSLRPVQVKRFFPKSEIGNSYTNAIRTIINSCDIDPQERNVLIAHQFVTSGQDTPVRADEELSLGGMDNVEASVFEAFDYVALGHVHRPQRIGRDTIRYSGSLLKYSFSEARFDKSAVLVDVSIKEDNEVGTCIQYQLLPLTPLHDMREIKGPLSMLTSDEVATSANRLDYIHAILTDGNPQLDVLSKIRAVYPNVMQIDYESNSSTGFANFTQDKASPEDMDPLELFKGFFTTYSGHEISAGQEDVVSKLLKNASTKLAGE